MSKPEEKKKNLKPSLAAVRVLEDLKGLLLLDGLFSDPVGEAFFRLLKWLAKDGEPDPQRGFRRYGKLWRRVVESGVLERKGRVGTLLQDCLLERWLEDDNPFHRAAEKGHLSEMDPSLHSFYIKDLSVLRRILKTDWEAEFLKRSGFLGRVEAPSLEGVREPKGMAETPSAKSRRRLKEKLLGAGDAELVAEIGDHFFQNGFGDFGRYRAFRWKDGLQGVGSPDPIRLEELVGYDEQRQPLLDNIEAFLKGKTANHVLIYGERGTGKSSTVKALLNRYQGQGLRLVEVHPDQLNEYQRILPLLRGRREKFILFVDDLSFEENETSYKGLKALLEGSVEAKPINVILIATSNRRHLVREFFGDRAGGLQQDGEIHGADTVEEKLSLSDRFGLVISFYSPDQDTFLRMVENWAKVEGIKMSASDLRAKAIQWEKSNNVRSGRTARQFINDLIGRI